MAKILQFPKAKSTRAQLIKRALQQKAVLPLSLLSVFVVTLSLNAWIQMASQKINSVRGVASVPAQDLEKQMKLERNWASQLQSEKMRPGLMAEQPSQLDHLLFGVLQGDVKMTRSGSLISELEMKKPVELKDREKFLESYRSVWSVNFDRVKLDSANNNQETYTLLDKDGKAVGRAIFGLESLQNVTRLQFLTQ